MDIQELREKISEFEKKAGFDKTDTFELIKMIEDELNILKKEDIGDKIVNNKITDLLVLVLQISNRYDLDFESELSQWFEKSNKYLKQAR